MRSFARGLRYGTQFVRRLPTQYGSCCSRNSRFSFHTTPSLQKVKPYLLADIGEGITECRIARWFVTPGDRVNQFDAICEVQSDKASVEITSRYDGIVTDIHHEIDDMAVVGKPLLDIDVEEDPSEAEESMAHQPVAGSASEETDTEIPAVAEAPADANPPTASEPLTQQEAKNSGLVVPAVRHMLKEHGIDIKDVESSGKGGRVTKADVQRYLNTRVPYSSTPSVIATTKTEAQTGDQVVPLTTMESQMFKVMTHALSIPHFGYSHSVDFTALNSLRRKSNNQKELSAEIQENATSKLTPLPFIMKALSQAFLSYPKLNAHLDTESDPHTPRLVIKESHDFGIAVDTPHGLLVPVVKGVQNHSIFSLMAEIKRLSTLAKESRLGPSDMRGATFTVSNIGSIGGSVVSPVIVPPMVAIIGVGKVEEAPVIVRNEQGKASITIRDKAVLSWSADHRILDGASVARCAEVMGRTLDNMEQVGLALR